MPSVITCPECGVRHSDIYLPYCVNPSCKRYSKSIIRDRKPDIQKTKREIEDYR